MEYSRVDKREKIIHLVFYCIDLLTLSIDWQLKLKLQKIPSLIYHLSNKPNPSYQALLPCSDYLPTITLIKKSKQSIKILSIYLLSTLNYLRFLWLLMETLKFILVLPFYKMKNFNVKLWNYKLKMSKQINYSYYKIKTSLLLYQYLKTANKLFYKLLHRIALSLKDTLFLKQLNYLLLSTVVNFN